MNAPEFGGPRRTPAPSARHALLCGRRRFLLQRLGLPSSEHQFRDTGSGQGSSHLLDQYWRRYRLHDEIDEPEHEPSTVAQMMWPPEGLALGMRRPGAINFGSALVQGKRYCLVPNHPPGLANGRPRRSPVPPIAALGGYARSSLPPASPKYRTGENRPEREASKFEVPNGQPPLCALKGM